MQYYSLIAGSLISQADDFRGSRLPARTSVVKASLDSGGIRNQLLMITGRELPGHAAIARGRLKNDVDIF